MAPAIRCARSDLQALALRVSPLVFPAAHYTVRVTTATFFGTGVARTYTSRRKTIRTSIVLPTVTIPLEPYRYWRSRAVVAAGKCHA